MLADERRAFLQSEASFLWLGGIRQEVIFLTVQAEGKCPTLHQPLKEGVSLTSHTLKTLKKLISVLEKISDVSTQVVIM